MAKEKIYSSIVDELLDDREPDWKDLGLEAEHKSGEEVLDRTHSMVDTDFMDDIAESASKHTPVWGPKSGRAEYENRIADKEAAQPRVNAVKADWHKDARRDGDAYKSEHGDNDSLMAEVTESLESAARGSDLSENSVEKKSITDAQVFKYVRKLLNQGMAPSKVAAQLKKLAEIELFNHQSATDYLQRNAGLIGLAYLEPNTYMDKSSPTYEHTAASGSKKKEKRCADCGEKGVSTGHMGCQEPGRVSEHWSSKEADTAVHYHEEPGGSPREQFPCGDFEGQLEKTLNKRDPFISQKPVHQASSNDCVQQKKAWDNAGIKPQARSVKQVKACEGCAYFKRNTGSKTCTLYGLPVVSNEKELSQIVNHLTPGVPVKQKHAALIVLANGDDKRVQTVVAAAHTNIIKTADAKVRNQSKRASHEYGDVRERSRHFEAEHVAKMHDKGASLEQIYKWASEKFGGVDTSLAFRGFVQNLKKNATGRIVVASADLKFLNNLGIRNEAYMAAAKCASCPSHFNREVREVESDRGAQRVGGKFAQRTASATATLTETKQPNVVVTASKVRTLHQAGHSVEKIYKGAASKVGSVAARKVVATFVEDMKKRPGKIAVSEQDRAFLVGKLGFKPEQVRLLDPQRRPVTQVVASVPNDKHVIGYPGMDKQAGERKSTDGHSILAEYDLANAAEMQDIEPIKNDYDVEMDKTFKVELD